MRLQGTKHLGQLSGPILGERWASSARMAPCVCRRLKSWASFVDAAEETLGQGNEGRFLNDRRDCTDNCALAERVLSGSSQVGVCLSAVC